MGFFRGLVTGETYSKRDEAYKNIHEKYERDKEALKEFYNITDYSYEYLEKIALLNVKGADDDEERSPSRYVYSYILVVFNILCQHRVITKIIS